jgi:membrane protein required for colicin V production
VDGSVTAFDAVVLGVLLLSGLLALVRGFVREALSVAAFVAAALAALWMLPVLREPVRGIVQPNWAADGAALIAVFLLVFLAVTMVTTSIAKQLGRGDEPGMADRIGGLAFGVARGLVILALFVIAWTAIVPADRPARWLTEARLYPLISSTALALQELAPETSRIAEAEIAPPANAEERPAPRAAEVPAAAPAPEEAAYSDSAADALDRLVGAAAEQDEGTVQ